MMITTKKLTDMLAIADMTCETGPAVELANELLAARERIAALEAAQRWIPVSERMPDKPGKYLVCSLEDDGAREVYHTVYTAYWHTNNLITHWMPLPEPPEVRA